MKKITLSELKQLKGVREISNKNVIDLKGGGGKYTLVPTIKGIFVHTKGFIPPPGI